MESKDGKMGFDFWGIYDEVEPYHILNSTLGDERKVFVTSNLSPPAPISSKRLKRKARTPWSYNGKAGNPFWTATGDMWRSSDSYHNKRIQKPAERRALFFC
ncbi:MAG: hypothetical protein R2881_09370 [Eubacteriales bacterium]